MVSVPRNDQLDAEPYCSPDYLYISHLHRDHFDPDFLQAKVSKHTQVLLPDFPVPYLERALRKLGFSRFLHVADGVPMTLDGLEATIWTMNELADGPLGDSLLALSDDTGRMLNQNDARPSDIAPLLAGGPFDLQFVQFSGAIWYPIAYDFPPDEKARIGKEKRANQTERARNYIQWIGASHVAPCAGPPAFLDPELWDANDFDRDPANIFPDQTVFLDDLESQGIETGCLVVPGSVIEFDRDSFDIAHPASAQATVRPFADKRAYLAEYQRDWLEWLENERATWSQSAHDDLVGELREWLEPILRRARLLSTGVAGNVVLSFADGDGIVIDFVDSEVRVSNGDPWVYKIDVDRRLIEACVERHLEDWVNSLFLSCRFTAHREGGFNEYIMTFFKGLSIDRIDHIEQVLSAARSTTESIAVDGWKIQRFCPHRGADLARFGTISDGVLTCSLHHWEFELETGRCLTSDGVRLQCERIDDRPDPGGA